MDINTEILGLNPSDKNLLTALQYGDIQLEGQFLNSSNYTFLCLLKYEQETIRVVYKPRKGEQPLWDFPEGTLTRRETAAYLVSAALGWNLVPACIYRTRKTPLGAGSVQVYIEHDPEYHYFKFSETEKQTLQPLVLFDLVINNADRKGGHVFFDGQKHLWAIDHGLCFHVEDKLRTVIWDFAGQEIPAALLQDLKRLVSELEKDKPLFVMLSKVITGERNSCPGSALPGIY